MPPVRRRSPRATPRRGRSSSVASVISIASTNGGQSPPLSASKPKRARKSKAARPALPTEKNPRLENHPEQPVRLQLIEREEQEIIVGRVKLPSVNGHDHAFLLKRFDTDAVAASSMYRVAFPFANEAAEATEMKYLESRYNTDVANGGRIATMLPDSNETPVKRGRGRPKKNETPRNDGVATDTESIAGSSVGDAVRALPPGSTGVRLQGTWIPARDATEVAREYGILKFAEPLINAVAKMAEDGSGPMLVESAAHKTPEKKRGRPSKRARKAKDEDTEPEQDQLTDETSAADEAGRPRLEIRSTQTYNSAGELTSITLGPWFDGMSEDEEYEDENGEPIYSGCVPVPQPSRAAPRTEPATAAERSTEVVASESTSVEFSSSEPTAAAVASSDLTVPSGPAPLSQAEIDAQIEEAKALAAGIQRAASAALSAPAAADVPRGQKRAAVNDTPTADLEHALDDDEDDEDASRRGRVVRAFRRGTRVARQRPVATTAGVLTAAGAIGAGAAAAFMTGVDVNTAFQTISQTVQSLGIHNWFF
ncbi:hypothetical protein ACQY0O_006330 [Thecaphora frezii]